MSGPAATALRPAPVPPRPEREVEAPARPALRVVPPRRRRLRTGRTFVVGGALAFLIAFALVFFQTMLVQGQAGLDDLDRRIAQATEAGNDLRLRVAELEAPERIVDAATSDLGMVPPPGITYLTPSGLVTVPAADAPEDGAEP